MARGYKKDGTKLGFQKRYVPWNKNKISESHKGMKYSDEVKKRVSLAHIGLKYNRRKWSENVK